MRQAPLVQSLKRAADNPRVETGANVLAIFFLLASLWLPPASLGVRVLHSDYPAVGAAGGVISLADGAQVLIPQGALNRQLRLKISSLSGEDFLSGAGDKAEDAAAVALTTEPIALQGDVYRISTYGPTPKEAVLTLPLPEGLAATSADLYTWDGRKWAWTPAHVVAEENVLEAHLTTLPMLATAAQARRASPSIAALGVGVVSDKVQGILSEVNPVGYVVSSDGTLQEVPTEGGLVGPKEYLIVPVVSNRVDGTARSEVLTSILLNPDARSRNVAALSTLAVEKMYTGVQLDYAGLDPKLGEEFASFVREVADDLHKQGKLLNVRVPEPKQIAEDRWDTVPYDWEALGQVADVLVVPSLESPAAYAPGGRMETLLQWAVGVVNRSKLQIVVSGYSQKIVEGITTRIPYLEALSEVAQLAIEGQKDMVSPGEDVTLQLPKLVESGGLRYDKDSATYWMAFKDEQGKDCQIWLENASSIARKLQLVSDYGVRGLTFEGLVGEQSDERIWSVLQRFKELVTASTDSDFTVVWSIEGPSGSEQSGVTSALNSPRYVWQAPMTPGDYRFAAGISDDGGHTINVTSNSVSVEIPTPTPTPTPTPLPTPTPKPTPKPAAAPPASPSRGPGFDYGIQGDAITDSDHGRLFGAVQQIGFRWFKQQVEWFRYNPAPGQYGDWGPLDRIADSARAAGIKVLFSVVKAPQWSRPPGDTEQGPPADPAAYAEFMKAMASHFKGRVQAYEVWNEQNLYYEWGGFGNKLNAGKYVQLLKAAYAAIKSVDSSATVISGALTPTGFNDGNTAIDDRVYLEQMYQAGVKNYCDAIGAHPSGYNNPPDAKWDTYSDPSKSFNPPPHPSWFFRGTLEGYRNIMVKYGDGSKRIWVTEFGWASVDGLGVAPAKGYEYAADNTEAEQAQYITRAYQLAKGWGWVGPMFLWNLNFGCICGPQDEKAAFGILRPDGSPRQAFAALANMPK
jgi:spore germination protein YaaH